VVISETLIVMGLVEEQQELVEMIIQEKGKPINEKSKNLE
jgi:hypothetical protein